MPKIITDKNKIEELLSRGIEEIIIKDELRKKLFSGKKLRIKFGIDPTGSLLHLGHAVVLRKLREFQDLGHQVIFLIGDFTARIGDPSGKASARKPLSDDVIRKNMKSYVNQASLILNMPEVEVRYNSEWLGKLNYKDVIELTSKVTFAQVAQRADFKKRIKNDVDLTLQEFMYPVMQGYDSVVLKADVEIGGTDQKFNLLMGRQLQKRYNQKPQDIITCPLLEGLYGKDKMSKSLNNYIALIEKAEEMYGKIMSLTDDLICRYFELCAYLPMDEINKMKRQLKEDKVNPRDLKMKLAREIVKIYHGEKKAREAEEYFVRTIQKKEAPEEIETRNIKQGTWNIINLLVEIKFANSKGEARRLVEQGGIKAEGEVVKDVSRKIKITKEGVLLQRGKRRFVRITN